MKTKYLVRTAAVLLATLSFAQEEENMRRLEFSAHYGIFYRRNMGSKFTASVGFYLFSEVDQTMDLDAQNNFIMLREYSSIEGGFFLGSDYYFYKRSDFEIGVQFKLFSYFAISEFDIEAISLSPKIRFFF